ncbi:MAG TPA: hypothetical protein VNT79_01145, partial [Phycisphaerae bacterium]|nr:hypothetical protein [Phycisphaerae bacterium]
MPPATTQKSDELLRAYYSTSTKYFVVPVPARIDRAAAVDFIRDRVKTTESKQKIGKLSRLAIFHDLSETADTFASLLNRAESTGDDYARSATAITTIAWIGDEAQISAAQKYFQALLQRASVLRDRQVMLAACDALGAREGTQNIRKWIQKEIDRLEAAANKREAAPGEAANTRNQVADLKEFLAFQVTQVDNANAARQKIAKMTPAETTIRPLADCYLRENQDDAPTLEYWSAITLVHLGRDQPAIAPRVGDEFLKRAQ